MDLLLLPYGGRNLCVTARAVIIGTRCSLLIGLWVIVDYEIGRKLIHYPFLYFILIWALHTFQQFFPTKCPMHYFTDLWLVWNYRAEQSLIFDFFHERT